MKKKVLCLVLAIVAVLSLGVQTCLAVTYCPYCYNYTASIYCNGTQTQYVTKHDYQDNQGVWRECEVTHYAHYVTLSCSSCGRYSSTWSRHDYQTWHDGYCDYHGYNPGTPCFSY